MPTNEELYDTYLSAVSAPDHDHRVRLLTQCALPDFEIVSPAYVARGLDAVATKLGELAAARPDGVLRLRRASPLDGHNTVFRVAFENLDAAGKVAVRGLHVGETRDGRLARILVFAPTELPSTSSS